jgi:hypothetical protein
LWEDFAACANFAETPDFAALHPGYRLLGDKDTSRYRVHRRGAEDAEEKSVKRKLRVLCGHEKKFKNHQNCKFGLNEIK